MREPEIGELRRAAGSIAPYVHATPLLHSQQLSGSAGCQVYLKTELFQKTGSYKVRGMLWAVMSLTDDQRRAGVTTFSAGNAAQGLAYAAHMFGTRATIFMPERASRSKVAATQSYGAEVFHATTGSECFDRCKEFASRTGATFVPSYDDETVMDGHASVGLEIFDALPDVRAIYTPIGGGGLIGGLIKAAAALGHRAAIHGVEPVGAAVMTDSLKAGRAVRLAKVDTVADGLGAPAAGVACFDLVQRHVASVMLVDDEKIVEALRLLMSRCKLYCEPAGAAALAGLLASKARPDPADKVVLIVSGGNMDFAKAKALL